MAFDIPANQIVQGDTEYEAGDTGHDEDEYYGEEDSDALQ